MSRSLQSAERDIVFIGGGPSAIAALGALLDNGTFRSATIVEPLEIGIGKVFGPTCAGDPGLLCNSPAGTTYTDHANPGEFADFLSRRGWPASTDDYTPRFMFGEFCRDKFLRLRDIATARGITVEQVRARVSTVTRSDHGYELALDNGDALTASDVIVCVGLEAPQLAPVVADYVGHPTLFHGTYPAERLRAVGSGARVLILGLRSSAIDAAHILTRGGSNVVLTSPSGRVSAVRDRLRIPPKRHLIRERWLALDPDDPQIEQQAAELLVQAVTAAGDGVVVSDQVVPMTDAASRLREEIVLAEGEKTYWADLVYDGIPLVNELVGSWDADARKRLMPKAYELLTRYVNALPILIAHRLLDSIDQGKAAISPVFVQTVVPTGDTGWAVTWSDGQVEHFDAVVSATGYNFPRFLQPDDNTIVLGDAGSVTPDTRLATITADLALSLDGGRSTERIWAVGAATNQHFPLAHIIYLAARQSQLVAPQVFASSADSVSAPSVQPVGVSA